MSTRKRPRKSTAVQFLHDRYIGSDPKRLASLEKERASAAIARTIYDLRTKAGLTQHQLAKLVGTTSSVICRLEDADYHGHSLGMLWRIGSALNQRLEIRFVPRRARLKKTA